MSDKTSDRLLPCPFCGGEAWLREHTALNGKTNYYVECGYIECGVSPETSIFVTPEEAIDAWNARKPMERTLERLEERKGTCNGHKCEKDGCAGCVDCKIENAFTDAIEIVKEEGGIE